MNQTYAKVVLDSVCNDKRLTTIECKYWRAIHSEIMTHRDRARNAMSSRAIPFYRASKEPCDRCNASGDVTGSSGGTWKCTHCDGTKIQPVPNCTYAMIRDEPFIPEFIGSEKKGMQSGSELEGGDRIDAKRSMFKMKNFCLAEAKKMFDLGVHKSIINRYLEPWSYITVVMTATEWKNFFRLRIHPKAEKHFDQLAKMIKAAIDASVPQQLKNGDWHMPYLRPEDGIDPMIMNCDMSNKEYFLKRISAARSARVSFLTHDGRRDIADDLRLFNDLIHPKTDDGLDDDAIHASALEHVAQAGYDGRSGPFNGWYQLRKDFPNENVSG